MTTKGPTVWVYSARVKLAPQTMPGPAKHRVVLELLELPASEVPPGAGYPSRHEAKAAAKRKANATPEWAGDP